MVNVTYHQFLNHYELDTIQQQLELPTIIIESLKDPNELSHMRHFKDRYYFIVNIPYQRNHQVKVASIALVSYNQSVDFILPKDASIKHIEHLLDNSSSQSLLASFFIALYKQYELHLLEVKQTVKHFENEMFANVHKNNIKGLFVCNQSLGFIQNGLQGLGEIVRSILEQQPTQIYDESFDETYKDIQIESKQVDRMLKALQESINSILSTTSSLQDNQLNRTMKTLTAITLVLSIPTFITSFYGMNIDLPFQDHPQSLLIVSVSSFILTIIAVVILYKKDLL